MSLGDRIVREAGDAVIAADPSGMITLWNAGAERLFGYSEGEALAQRLDLIIPEAQRTRHWEGYRHVMSTGMTKYGTSLLRVPGIRKDGTRISIAFTVGLLKDAAGRIEGIFAILRDDTERWETEKALRNRVAALEKSAPGANPDLTGADVR